MILQRLKLAKYKMLKNIEIEFNKPISVFIGVNGSGKSSLLEALALIFSSAFEQILLKKDVIAPDEIIGCSVEYTLRFEEETEKDVMMSKFNIEYIPVKIEINHKGKIEIKINSDNEEFLKALSQDYIPEQLLPKRIISYYSGISKSFEVIHNKIQGQYLKRLIQDPNETESGYIKNIDLPIYVFDENDFDILLSVLFSFRYRDTVKDLLVNKLKLEPKNDFLQVIVNKKEFDNEEYSGRNKDVMTSSKTIKDDKKKLAFIYDELEKIKKERIDNFFGATGRLKNFLSQLRRSSLIPEKVYSEKFEKYEFKFDLDNWQKLSDEILTGPKELFELLYMLKHNGLLVSINVNLYKGNNEFSGQQLSEGEKQVVIINALNEILGLNNTLFMFDEPDTYLHPSLQDDLIINIQESNDYEYYQNHYFVTTHNPSLINNLDDDYGELFIMKQGKIIDHHLKWFGRDSNDVLTEIMGTESRPIWSRKLLNKIDYLLDKDVEEGAKLLEESKSKFPNDSIDIIRLQSKLDFLRD